VKASQARKLARDAHAAAELNCCGIKFTSKVALALHKREHRKADRNRLYPD
jgi:hypothetical protein